jgi:hypothetical protein
MLYGTNVAVCSKINAEHINTVCQNVKLSIFKPVSALLKQ